MGRVIGDSRVTAATLSVVTDPAALLEFAWAMEPDLRLAERYAALDRLAELLGSGLASPAPAGRDWEAELLAERAIDASAYLRLTDGQALARRVLEEAPVDARLARARATLALGRALVWVGTEEATRRGDATLQEAAILFEQLGATEWFGFTIFWRGHAVAYQHGDLRRAAELIGEALEVLGPDSPRRSSILTFYTDVLTDLGRFDESEATLAEAMTLADRDGSARSRAYAAWSGFRLAACRDDADAVEAMVRLGLANTADWFETMTGLDYLADAAVALDRVGRSARAREYLDQAQARVRTHGATTDDGSPYDEPLRLAEASLTARGGDPHAALDQLQELVRGNWLEKRLLWRNTMLTAWATLRAGSRGDAGVIAARALEEAAESGGVAVALSGDGQLTRALVPLADEAGSPHARALIADGGRFTIRLFGSPSLLSPEGAEIRLPAGMPGELVRWLALHPGGLDVSQVLDAFFPDVERATALSRLRQILTRVRAEGGDLIRREGEQLRLAPAWVDLRAFDAHAAAAARARGTRRLELSWAMSALAQRGPLLAGDPYAPWSADARERTDALLQSYAP